MNNESNHQSSKLPSLTFLTRRNIIIAAVIIILGFGGWLLFKSDNNPKSTSKNALQASYQKQLPSLAAKANDNPKDAKAQEAYAVALYATGDFSKAQSTYEAAVKLDSKNAALRNNLGNTYRDLGSYQKAVESYQQSIKINPKIEQPYINLANVYLYTLKQKDAAIKTYQEALRNIPNSPTLEVLLGIAYEQSGDKNNARATFQKVLDANPKNAAAEAGIKRVQ